MAHVFKHQLSYKKIFNNLDNLSYIQRTSFRGNDTLYNEKVQFKLTYPAVNGRHKENIEFRVVINLSPIYLDNFRHDGEINIFCAPNPKPVTMGRVFQTGVERVLFLFLNDFIEQFPMINPGVPSKERIHHILNPCIRITIPLQITYASLICLS